MEKWREDAATLRSYGAEARAEALEAQAEELDRAIREWRREPLKISEAAEETGYSAAHLRDLVHQGRLPAVVGPADDGPMTVRRSDLDGSWKDRNQNRDEPESGSAADQLRRAAGR